MPKIHKEPLYIQKARFLAAFNKSRGILMPALHECKIAWETYQKWIKTDAKFRKECVNVERAQADYVEFKLLDLIEQGDKTAIIFYLKCRRGDKWNDRSGASVQIASTGPITFQIGSQTDINKIEPEEDINLLEE